MTHYQRICIQCERKGITIEELAEMTGISKRRLQYLNRYYIFPNPEVLEKVSEALEIDPELLKVDLAY